jgi:hypothetical protein
VSLQANTQALMSLAGFDASDILLTAWDNDTFRPCHYVAVDRARQCLVRAVAVWLNLCVHISNSLKTRKGCADMAEQCCVQASVQDPSRGRHVNVAAQIDITAGPLAAVQACNTNLQTLVCPLAVLAAAAAVQVLAVRGSLGLGALETDIT